jgi:DNA-binding transcriptional regulator LsrR (DeoR family)
MPTIEATLDPVEVAEAYYAQPPRERCFKALAGKFGLPMTKASADRLSRMVRDVEERGLIHHEVLREKTEFLPRNPRLEDELRRQFGLRQAIVVDTCSLGLPKDHDAKRQDLWARHDDEIHMRLGAWGGRLLASCLRAGDTIATGGGRGPYFAVLKTNACTANRYSGRILPLTGQISARAWNHDGLRLDAPPYLDADNVASQLHSKLGTRGQLLSLNCPITELPNPPKTDKIDVAVFGIGALGGGHRLKQFQHLDDVKSVQRLLHDINTLAEAIERKTSHQGPPFFHPVGDVCNCYFVVECHEGQRQEKEWQELETKVAQLNKAFNSATPESLGHIAREGMVLAVAGGPHKAFSIRHVLRNSRQETWITHLVTDRKTAQWILQKEKESGTAAGANVRPADTTAKPGAPASAPKPSKP